MTSYSLLCWAYTQSLSLVGQLTCKLGCRHTFSSSGLEGQGEVWVRIQGYAWQRQHPP